MATLILQDCDHLLAICRQLPDAFSRKDQGLLHRLDNETKNVLALFQRHWDELMTRMAQIRQDGERAEIIRDDIHLLHTHILDTLNQLRTCQQLIGQRLLGTRESPEGYGLLG